MKRVVSVVVELNVVDDGVSTKGGLPSSFCNWQVLPIVLQRSGCFLLLVRFLSALNQLEETWNIFFVHLIFFFQELDHLWKCVEAKLLWNSYYLSRHASHILAEKKRRESILENHVSSKAKPSDRLHRKRRESIPFISPSSSPRELCYFLRLIWTVDMLVSWVEWVCFSLQAVGRKPIIIPSWILLETGAQSYSTVQCQCNTHAIYRGRYRGHLKVREH